MEKYSKLIYVAGRYTARQENGDWDWSQVTNNIELAEAATIKLWKKGWAVLCPHLNTNHFERYEDDNLSYMAWITGDLTILKRCDAIFILKNWESSKGTLGEIEFATKNDIPIFYEVDGIPTTEMYNKLQEKTNVKAS